MKSIEATSILWTCSFPCFRNPIWNNDTFSSSITSYVCANKYALSNVCQDFFHMKKTSFWKPFATCLPPKLLSLLKDQSFSRTSPVFSFGYNLFSFSCSWRVLPKDYIYMVVWLSSWCQLVHDMLLTHLVCTHIWCNFAFQAPSYCFSLVSWYNSKTVINCWEFQSSFLNSLMFIFSHINISIIRVTWLSGTPWQRGLELGDLYSPF